MTARLRLLLAILVLALVPVLMPGAGWASAVTAVGGAHECDHPCDAAAGAEHAQAACACSAHLALAPLMAVAHGIPAFAEPVPFPAAEDALSSTRWPPPLRPPRA